MQTHLRMRTLFTALLCAVVVASVGKAHALQPGAQIGKERQKSMLVNPLPTRKLATTVYTTNGHEHTLTLWDVPLPEGARDLRLPNSMQSAPTDYRFRAIYLLDTEGKKQDGKVVMLAYWRQTHFSNLIATLLPAPNGQIYLITGWVASTDVWWRVYAVDTKKDRGHTLPTWDRLDIARWPVEDQALDAVRASSGPDNAVSARAEMRGDALILHASLKDVELRGYWKLDLTDHTWTEVIEDQERPLRNFNPDYVLPPHDLPMPTGPSAGAGTR